MEGIWNETHLVLKKKAILKAFGLEKGRPSSLLRASKEIRSKERGTPLRETQRPLKLSAFLLRGRGGARFRGR